MNQDELRQLFDKQAPNYNSQWSKMFPVSAGLYFFLEPILSDLPAAARILCVGVGTGKELIYLANRFPHWRFTAVDPSGAMLEVCRQDAEKAGVAARCYFHEGYLESLSDAEFHDAATCFLVSQFVLAPDARAAFFRQIAAKLKPGGVLISSDLGAHASAEKYELLLRVWLRAMLNADVSAAQLDSYRAAYKKDVAVLPPAQIAAIIQSGGFDHPVQFYQAGMIHGFFASRSNEVN